MIKKYVLIFLLCLFFYFVNNFLFWHLIICLIFSLFINEVKFKFIWLMIVFFIPLFGMILFIFNYKKYEWRKNIKDFSGLEVISDDKIAVIQMRYLISCGFSLSENSEVVYLNNGDEYYLNLLRELRLATKFIFLEYYIVRRGLFFDSIVNVLKDKVKSGVEVYIILDLVGCCFNLSKKYINYLEESGINCFVFNKCFNNRNHRKICVIDGVVALTGGINLGDEYINVYKRFGHFKDNGVAMYGEVASSFAKMFINTWNELGGEINFDSCFSKFEGSGYVIGYESSVGIDSVSRNVYLNMIKTAINYIYITTPYFIVDREFMNCLINASLSGVKVYIVVPNIYDKFFVNEVSKSYYNDLINSGIKVILYTSGFIHCKMMIVDDNFAVVGTINFDYRSFYLNYENGVFLYKCSCIDDMKKDFLNLVKYGCEVKCEEFGVFKYIFRCILKLFSYFL